MFNLYLTSDNLNGFFPIFLDLVTIVCTLAAILTIISKNPIVSVLYLILLFSSLAVYLIFVGIKFIGISYLLVYVGAVSILFLFILMLINIRVSELVNETTNYIPLAILTILIFFIPLINLLPSNKFSLHKETLHINKFIANIEQLYYVSLNSWEDSISEISEISDIGNIMYANFLMWLVITSIILLLAMVGSIVITIKQKY